MKTRVNVSRMRKVRLLLRAAAGVVVTAILIAVAAEIGVAKPFRAIAEVSTDAPPAPSRAPLPREWRWERKPITFDHMFRQSERR